MKLLFTIFKKVFFVLTILLIGQIRIDSRCIGEHLKDALGKSLITLGRKIEATDAYQAASQTPGLSNILPTTPKIEPASQTPGLSNIHPTTPKIEPAITTRITKEERKPLGHPQNDHDKLSHGDQESLMKLLKN